MRVASALAFDYFRHAPADFVPAEAQNWAAIIVFLVVAVSANTVAGLARARAGEADMAGMRAEMGRVIEVVREFVPAEHWPAMQARLRGETPTRRQQPQVVERVRMVPIDDAPDEDDT